MFTLHTVSIRVPYGKPVKLIPFGDIHKDSESCDKGRWRDFLHKCRMEDDENTLYLEMGDPNDFSSASERDILMNRNLHDSTRKALDKMAREATKEFIEDIKFMQGRLIGVMEGNHRWEFCGKKAEDRITSDEMIAEALGTKFLGRMSYIRVKVLDSRNVHIVFDVVAHHGNTSKNVFSNKCAGTTINKVDDLRRVFPVADIYLMGHDHKRGGLPESTLVVDTESGQSKNPGQLKIKQKRQWLCRTGSFLRAYVDGEDSYVSNAAMRPCELGTIKLEIRCGRDRADGKDNIYPDIHLFS